MLWAAANPIHPRPATRTVANESRIIFEYARSKIGLSQDIRLIAQVRGPTKPGSGNVKLVTPNKCPQRSFKGGRTAKPAPHCVRRKGHVRCTSFERVGLCRLRIRVTVNCLSECYVFPVHKDSHAHEGLCGKVRRYARSRLQIVHHYISSSLSRFNLLPNYESISHSRSRSVFHESLPRTVPHI
jgi:hypothetical protein